MNENNQPRTKYRVWLHSRPSPGSTFYDGYVDVWSYSVEEAKMDAKKKLCRTSFPERGMDSWKVDKIEILE